ncbi:MULTISPECIES: MFS transporter [Micrococcus]|uniref:MFS family arabinose efflux permease n=1 Tax=Micrococcus aloeverae TaxID=1391911 RepID=A0ABR6DXY7_9MICC|nr:MULTISPECIES: MFS transporter [Micrococcus]MBA9081009.1 putative MFS family arabinose efflux permease [Micrococcus aloeverae]
MPSAPPPSDPAGSTAAPRPPLWTRPFILVSATYLFVAMIFYTLMTAMALYAVTSFGASDAEAGVVVGAFVLGAFVLGAVLTRMTTTPATFAWGRRRVLLVALACYVLTTAAYLWADSLAALTVVRLLNGMCFGAAGTVLATAVQRIVPPVRRSEGTGWFSTSMTLAGAVGPTVALQLSTTLGYDALFWACIGFTGMALLIALFLRVPEPPLTGRFRLHRADVFSAEVAPAAGVALASGFMYGGILAFMATFAQQQGYPAMVPSLFFLLFAAGTIVGRAVLGVLHDRHGDNAVVYPILAGMAVSYAVLALLLYYRLVHGGRAIARRPSPA